MHPIITNFFARLITDHIDEIRSKSYATGFRDGQVRLHPKIAKLQIELEEAKLRPASWVIRDEREKSQHECRGGCSWVISMRDCIV